MVHVLEQKLSMWDLMKLNVTYGENRQLMNHLEYLIKNGIVLHNNKQGFMYRLLSYSYTDTFIDNSRTFRFEIEIVQGLEEGVNIEYFPLLQVS